MEMIQGDKKMLKIALSQARKQGRLWNLKTAGAHEKNQDAGQQNGKEKEENGTFA